MDAQTRPKSPAELREEFCREMRVAPADLKIEALRLPTEAYQFAGKTLFRNQSLVRITHLPSGIAVECKEERSAQRNHASALAMLKLRLREISPLPHTMEHTDIPLARGRERG